MPENFKSIGLIGKYAKDDVSDSLKVLTEYLQSKNLTVYLDQGTADSIEVAGVQVLKRAELGETCDLIIVMGGDGSMLNAARSLASANVPLIGINRGHLGFLTDIPLEQMQEKLDEIFAGEYQAEDRLLLHAQIIRDGAIINENIALNDVVVHKWEEARMLEFETSIDKRFVNTQRSDGLIIATPTGSTAYALSGGGPIMNPSLHALALVPICPHTLSQRPLIVDGDCSIEILISESGHASAQVTADGQINLGVKAGDRIKIKRHDQKITLLHPSDYNYYEILRAKLHWGEKL